MDVYLVTSSRMRPLDSESVFLVDALKTIGVKSKLMDWDDDSVNWSKADLVVNRTTSDYTNNLDAYLRWAKAVDSVTTLWNSYPVIEWNHNKRYLLELSKAGAPVPDTTIIPQGSEISLQEIKESIKWDHFVLKPCICAGSGGLMHFKEVDSTVEEHFRDINSRGWTQIFPFGEYSFPPSDTVVQPYLPEITKYGEASLIYFGGEFSHAVLKKVQKGEFRAHPLWGADLSIYNPTEEEIQVGYDALGVVGHPTEYARLDMIPVKEGPIIIEVELIEPFLFFDILPDTVNSFAEHIKTGLNT